MHRIEDIKSIVVDIPSKEAEEKLDYLKNLEDIKVKLRQKILESVKKDVGVWYIDLNTNSFTCTSKISNIFNLDVKKSGLEYYFSTYKENELKDISEKIQKIQEDSKELTLERELTSLKSSNMSIVEHINYIPSKNLLTGTVQNLTQILHTHKNIINIDRVMNQIMKFFDKNITIIQCDKKGYVTYVSSAFCEASGFDKNYITGRPLSAIGCVPENINLEKIFTSLEKSHLTWNGEIKYIKKDKGIFWANAFISPIFNQDDELIEFTLLCQDITVQKLLEELTFNDPMTNVYNRRYYNEIIPKEINRAIRDKKKISFAMIDIDFFKQYNDIYGHRKGDDTLIAVANSLQNSLKRSSDYVFRMGGEEFCVVFSGKDEKKSKELCEKLRKNIENLQIPHSGSSIDEYITVSIGLVVSDLAHEIIDELGLYTTSDNALFRAKEAGRNQVFVHESSKIDFF